MSVEGIAREVNKYAGWAWNKFPGLPHKEYERVKFVFEHCFIINGPLHVPGDEIVIIRMEL